MDFMICPMGFLLRLEFFHINFMVCWLHFSAFIFIASSCLVLLFTPIHRPIDVFLPFRSLGRQLLQDPRMWLHYNRYSAYDGQTHLYVSRVFVKRTYNSPKDLPEKPS